MTNDLSEVEKYLLKKADKVIRAALEKQKTDEKDVSIKKQP
jgi:hypothetical protein